MKRRLALALMMCGAVLATPVVSGAASPPALALSIVHVLRGCHVWALENKPVGPSAAVAVKPGGAITVRVSCPMGFDVKQTLGPKVALAGPHWYPGTTRKIVFRKPGLYRLVAVSPQTSEEAGLPTLGADNTLRLTVRVK